MRASCLSAWMRLSVLTGAIVLSCLISASSAQVRIPQEALESPTELSSVYQQGGVMEREGRWGEALSLYERASRQFPNEPRLKEELNEARLHFDVRRRYSDASFTRMVRNSSLRDSLEIYQEVLLKIQTFHVDRPDWNAIVRRGAEALLATLNCDDFQQQFGVRVDEASRQRLISYLNRETLKQNIADRFAAQHAVHDFSVMVHEVHGIPAQAAVLEFACGATTALDWYSSFLTTDQYSEVMSQIDGNFVGLGVELKPKADFLDVISVIPNGPAALGGLAAGDHILAVDQRLVTELGGDQAADLLRGPEGSEVILQVQAPQGQQRMLRLKRSRVDIPSVEQRRVIDTDNGVAYIKLASFQRTTRDEVQSSLWELHRQGMRSLVLDLRGNPGGLLDAAVDVADMFLTGGTIVTTKGRNLDENSIRRARFEGTWRVPLVVLIDEDSASASEILAGALRDNQRATVVGHRSYGKGSVQGIFALNTCSAGIRLTTAKFYSPSGRAISNAGVEPDVPVPSDVDNPPLSGAAGVDQVVTLRPNNSLDPSLDLAIRVANRQLQRLQAGN